MTNSFTSQNVCTIFDGLCNLFSQKTGKSPVYAGCTIKRAADGYGYRAVIKLNKITDFHDDKIAYYCADTAAFKQLTKPVDGVEFIVAAVHKVSDNINDFIEDSGAVEPVGKVSFESLKADYFAQSVCMAELLATEPADGLTLEQAFELYVRAKSWADDDVFQVIRDGETVEL